MIYVPWDKQETALLMDAYLRVKNKEVSQQEAVKEVSELLRRRAILSGKEIDDVFRNVNGVRIQMKIVGGLIDDCPSGLYSGTKMFNAMVTLYKRNPVEFNEILNQAKAECGIQMNLQEKFFAWLKNRVSSAQLSEFYVVCEEIESFCLSKRILTQPLFETTNTVVIQDVINTIKANRTFQFEYFRHLGKMRKVMDFYMRFLQEAPWRQSKEGEKSLTANVIAPSGKYREAQNATASNTSSIPVAVEDDATVSVSEEENALAETNVSPVKAITEDGVATTEDNKGDSFVWNFANDNVDFSSTAPSAITYFDQEEKVQDWADAFVRIFRALQEDYPSIIRGMVDYRFVGIGKTVLASVFGIGRLSKPVELNNGLYIETNCSPDEIVSIVRLLMDKCNVDYDNIGIHYRKSELNNAVIESQRDDDIVAASPDEKSDTASENVVGVASAADRKAAFESWLITDAGLAKRTAQSYSSAINAAGQYSVRLGFSEKELFLILSAEQVFQISIKLLADPEFARLNDGQHNRYRAALSKYWDYCKTLSGEVALGAPIKKAAVQESEIKKKRIAFIAWAKSQQMQEAAILAYLSDMKKCSEFARENHYIQEEHMLLIQDTDVLERVFSEMRKDPRFMELNSKRQKRPVSAMNKLIAFRKAAAAEEQPPSISLPATSVEESIQSPGVSVSMTSADPQIKERYTAILTENFMDGLRPKKAIDRNRFRVYYGEMFKEELTENDEQLVCTLMKIGTFRDERIFAKDAPEQKDLIEEINAAIMEAFKNGASCIYLECLFARFQEQLAEMLHIYTVDSLENVLFSSGKRNYFKRYSYLSEYNKDSSPAIDVVEYMKRSHLPVTYSEMETNLWYIPLATVKQALVTTPEIVNVASESYLYAPNLPVSDNEIQQIAELISRALLQHSFISDVELMQLIEKHCPSVLMNTSNYPVWGLRNALAYLLRDQFSFRGAIISDKSEEICMAEVFSDFCQHSERITVDELKQFASELNATIYWDSVYAEMIRVNQNEFVRKDQIHFDIEKTDAVLDNLIQSAYVPIKAINLFLHFPAIDVPWNNFVLESYVARYSKKFRLLHASYSATDCCGAIIRQNSGISDYRTLIVDVLVNSPSWNTKKDALQLLVDLGYQQRRTYSDIEKVMQEANAKLQTPK